MLKKQMSIILMLFVLILSGKANSQADPAITELFRNSYHIWELMRNDKGMYRDSKVFSGSDYHPASVANVGVGLISLCIADAMGWEPNAANLAIKTLESVTGHTPGFTPDRNASGWFRHWIDMNTGARAWNSEYSTIDTSILVMGATFAKSCFSGNATVANYADELFNSIDFPSSISDANAGKIYMEMHANGSGISGSETSVYNEYMLVAWLAIKDNNNSTVVAQQLWNKFYADPDTNMPISYYGGHGVLSDQPGSFVSSFIHLFNYYFCHYFKQTPAYMTYLGNSRAADQQWFINNGSSGYDWGNGAGEAIGMYSADKVNHNPNKIVSPHIIAGYIPLDSFWRKQDLLSLFSNNKGVFGLPDNPAKKILWRFSLVNPGWVPNVIQGIDYSTMLFGLASLPEYLGENWFHTHNNL